MRIDSIRGLLCTPARMAGVVVLLLSSWPASFGQISFSSAMDLALRNDPRVKLAQDDLRRSVAVRQEVKDAYLPTAAANGGAGYTYGITLTVPTVFTLDAQSVIYSPSQRHYTAASRWELKAAQLAVTTAREQVEEDFAVTYISLALAQQKEEALASEYTHAQALAEIVEKRLNAGIESQLEWKQARRTAAQVHLQLLQQQDEEENLRAHIAQMTGLPSEGFRVSPDSIPNIPEPRDNGKELIERGDSPDLIHAKAQEEGRRERALGDAHGSWKPVVTFNAQYARVSPINNVTDYYNLHGRYNIFSLGATVHFPFLDPAARARQREAEADAARASHELLTMQFHQSDDRRNLQHSLEELSARLEVADLDAGIAADQFALTKKLSVKGGDGAAVMNPKDVERAAMDERQRYTELLDATLQLRRVQIFYLRQTGMLDQWVQSTRGISSVMSAPRQNSTISAGP